MSKWWEYVTNEQFGSIDRGYFQVRESYRNTPYGTTILTKTTLVTPKGQVWLVGKVSEWMPISEREEIS